MSTQCKLLRVLQEKEIERVGDQTPIEVDVRVISATHRNLRQLIEEGTFREDLFYRLNVIPIHIPPLRERKEDIPLLVETFIRELRVKTNKQIKGISRRAMDAIWAYSWPGNIRELINALEYAFVICSEEMIHISHLPDTVVASESKGTLGAPLEADDSVKKQLIEALNRAHGKKIEAAKILGISRQALWKRLRKYGIEVEKTISTK